MKPRVEVRTGSKYTSIREFSDVGVAKKWAKAEVSDPESPLYQKQLRVVASKVKTAEDVIDFEDDVGPYGDVGDLPKEEAPTETMFTAHPLTLLVLELRYLSMVSQQLHWTISGPSATSDHLLLKGLYETANTSFDKIAERLQGLSVSPPTVDQQAAYVLSKTAVQVTSLIDVYGRLMDTVGVFNTVTTQGMSSGTANLVQGIADVLEEQAYFFGQRVGVLTSASS